MNFDYGISLFGSLLGENSSSGGVNTQVLYTYTLKAHPNSSSSVTYVPPKSSSENRQNVHQIKLRWVKVAVQTRGHAVASLEGYPARTDRAKNVLSMDRMRLMPSLQAAVPRLEVLRMLMRSKGTMAMTMAKMNVHT